ncbi:thioesterase II family protein [Streptomyces sp. NRRL WC-3742]|uniref:thioesterase II family protein n=1 Tax=Streptomyces sp. NRRL WC-3742 TaxID=1463934 RepID=UPI0004C75DE7|nr:alpha/beta fold hydrolase [Streptomyces sp. NRRL WC-3742]
MIAAGVDSAWFRRYPAPAGRTERRLVCLPHAGGAAGLFHLWGGQLGPGVEVLAARYPGRQERIAEPCLDSMPRLADAVTAALLPHLDRPLALFGHSMGASLAYEVALRLEHLHGVRPHALFVSARRAPHRVRPKEAYLGGDRAIVEEVRRLGGTDVGLLDDPDLYELVMPAIRADFRIVGTYRPQPGHPVHCPVVGYVGDGDPEVSAADLREWAEVTTGGFDLAVLPGDHFYLNRQRDALVRDLAARLG